MSKRKFPKKIESMILTAYYKGWSAKKTANHINKTRTAMKLGEEYTHRSIASKFANLTRI